MIITLKQLKELNACSDQVALFEKWFGDKVRVTKALCIKHAKDFDFEWAAENLLSSMALHEYYKARAAALAEYEKATEPALAEYKKAEAPALAEYEKATEPALAEYEKATEPALAEYEKATALAFWRASRIKAAA